MVRSPITGQEYVVEASAGGLVGTSVAVIKAALAGCSRAEVKAQLAKGREQLQRVSLAGTPEFWWAVEKIVG